MPNDVQISELTKVTETPNSSDLLLIRHGTVDSKIEYKDLKAAITTNTLFVNPNGVVTQASNPYYNKSEVNNLISGLQGQIDTLSDKWSSPMITSLEELNTALSSLSSRQRMSLLLAGTATSPLVGANAASTAYVTKMDTATVDMFLFSLSGDFIGTVRYNFSTSTVVKKYDINEMIIHNRYVEIPQNTTTFDIFDGIISSIGSFEGKLFQVQVSSGVVLGGVPVSGGRKLCQILRHSTTNYATILMMGWANDGELYHLIKINGTWSCTRLPTRAEIDNAVSHVVSITREIASNTDINTLLTPGTYVCPNGTTSNTLVNWPDPGVGGRLEVVSILRTIGNPNSDRLRQFVYSNNTYRIYQRSWTGSLWTDWVLQPTREEFNALAEKNKIGTISAGGSVSLAISSHISTSVGYALVALNISGNAASGVELLFLGKGTGKSKPLLGSMSASNYSLSYNSPTWTITNNTDTDMFYSANLIIDI